MHRSTTPVPQTALTRIQEMIRTGELRSGESLPPQRVLAERLNVSRGSLREALSVLEAMGALLTQPRRGTFVVEPAERAAEPLRWQFDRSFSPLEVYQFRFVVEGYAARLAAMRATSRQVHALRRNLEKLKQALREEDMVASSRIDFEFHGQITKIAGNRMFSAVHTSYGAVVLESQKLPFLRRERRWEPVTEHENIVEAIEQQDPDGALYFMHVHILRAAGRIGIELTDKVA